ncbi:MAG: putative Ig domain-containing protein [Gammaproteobacteria bacterium]|nr:putative Ig domain-containing protein [Gammaproteobacteria bacterium]
MKLSYFLSTLLVLLGLAIPGQLLAQTNLDCETDAQVQTSFDNGAQWSFCWESRVRENIVLRDISYTSPSGENFPVMSSARLAQLHVAYDDNNVTYNDITEYGLGGAYMTELTAEDCPNGELIYVLSRAGICLTRGSENDSYRTAGRAVKAESINLFSLSQVGAYAYLVSWTFYDNGAIEPAVGATGALQRSSTQTEAPFGRSLDGDENTVWLSHTHNYYWRLDFDLGDSSTDDRATETRYPLGNDGKRTASARQLLTEEALRIDPASYQNWTIWNSEPVHLNSDADPSAPLEWGYRIEPLRYGHRLVREVNEPYTGFDFFVTVANDCERFASQNARFNPNCLNTVLQYADEESLVDADLVAWHRVSFHHTPRNEDQRNMHSHWDGFVIEPVNLLEETASFDSSANQPPQFTDVHDFEHALDENVSVQLTAMDPEGDTINFSAEGLPPGLSITSSGQVTGTPEQLGSYHVTLFASDAVETSAAAIHWDIVERQSDGKSSGGFGPMAPVSLFVYALIVLMRKLH